jgi:hypothetical protein
LNICSQKEFEDSKGVVRTQWSEEFEDSKGVVRTQWSEEKGQKDKQRCTNIHIQLGVKSGAPEGQAVAAPLVAPVTTIIQLKMFSLIQLTLVFSFKTFFFHFS